MLGRLVAPHLKDPEDPAFNIWHLDVRQIASRQRRTAVRQFDEPKQDEDRSSPAIQWKE